MSEKSYMLPEWAPVRAVLLAWPYPGSDWQNNLQAAQQCYQGILRAVSAHVPVWLLVHPKVGAKALQAYCEQEQLGQVSIIEQLYDDTWLRDYGPISLSDRHIALTFNGWGGKYSAKNDNAVATGLSQLKVEKFDFVCEGGALESNGSVLLANKDCVVDPKRNATMALVEVEQNLRRLLGLEDIEWLEDVNLTGDDTDGHIDTIVRFAGEHTLLYAGRNPDHTDAQALNSLHTQVQGIAQRRGWQCFELPSPEIRSLVDGRILPATYANFLIANECVFVPTYGVEEDRAALDVIAQAFNEEFKHYTIVPIRCEALLEQHGSLHCATMQVAEFQKPG